MGAENIVTRKLETLFNRNDMLNICPEVNQSDWKSKFVEETLEAKPAYPAERRINFVDWQSLLNPFHFVRKSTDSLHREVAFGKHASRFGALQDQKP